MIRASSTRWWFVLLAVACVCSSRGLAQENPLSDVKTAPAPEVKPKSEFADAPKGPVIRATTDLVLVPVAVTDPHNRLVTGLEKENFEVYDNTVRQTLKSFATEDAPISIGIIFDLSGSMTDKFGRSRKALTAFLRTSNPQDEFFVVGFNDRPAVIVDYTNDVDDVEARMVMLRPQNRTALVDAMYLGLDHLKQAKYQRKALLVISDGGDNRSRYTTGELMRAIRESDTQIYALGIFDEFAPTEEEQNGPLLLNDVCTATGGRMFKVLDLRDLADLAQRISEELREEYVLGYTPTDHKHDGQWRKLKVRLVPPQGLPTLTAHSREGYYAPSQ